METRTLHTRDIVVWSTFTHNRDWAKDNTLNQAFLMDY